MADSTLSASERARRLRSGAGERSAPVPLLIPALIAVVFLVLPLFGLLVRAPWTRLVSILTQPEAVQALQLSLWTSTLATLISLVIGVPLAWVLSRTTFPGQRLVRALVTLPLVLPPVVGGVALLLVDGLVEQRQPGGRGARRPAMRHAAEASHARLGAIG